MRRLAGILGLLCVSGCTVGPDYKSPTVEKVAPAKLDAAEAPDASAAGIVAGSPIAPEWWTTLKDDKLTVKLANGQTTEGTFKFDASAKPKTIDLIPNDDKKPKALCIYQLDGDKLKLCMIDKPGVDRPTEFKSGPNTYLLEFKREKP